MNRAAPTTAKPPESVATRLDTLSAAQGRLARMAFDRRFPVWIDALLGAAGTRIAYGEQPAGVAITLANDQGLLELCGDAAAWPALEMAARLSDQALARGVAEAILAAPLSALDKAMPGLSVQRVGMRSPGGRHIELRHGDVRVGLTSLDEGMANHLAHTVRSAVRANPAHFRRLRIPASLGLFVRDLTLANLNSLAPGDIVVAGESHAGAKHLRSRLSFGLGITMQATTTVDIDASTATLTERPRLIEDDTDAAQPPLDAIADLSVPVAFEIDSARVSLDELAAFGEGSVIELEVPVREATVRLVCFGQVVGTGQLVVVGERLGVRIGRMGLRPAGGRRA